MDFQKDYCPSFSRQFNKTGIIGVYGFAAIT
jgi:hypothetical protein